MCMFAYVCMQTTMYLFDKPVWKFVFFQSHRSWNWAVKDFELCLYPFPVLPQPPRLHIHTSTHTGALAVAHVHTGNRSAGRVREVTPVSHGQGRDTPQARHFLWQLSGGTELHVLLAPPTLRDGWRPVWSGPWHLRVRHFPVFLSSVYLSFLSFPFLSLFSPLSSSFHRYHDSLNTFFLLFFSSSSSSSSFFFYYFQF